ncbi:MAG: serine hydrolase [Pseudomonadales bacterium]
MDLYTGDRTSRISYLWRAGAVPGRRALLAGSLCLAMLCGLPSSAVAYPLDGAEDSGIRRLIGYRNAQQAPSGPKIASGGLLATTDIRLTLIKQADAPMFDTQPMDPELLTAVESIFAERDPSNGFVVVDLSQPDRIVWAGVRPDVRQNPGSVGKLLPLIALFDGLARAFPDVEARKRVLRETQVTGADWTLSDEHAVPKFDAETGTNTFSIIRPEDTFTLAEWIDHMVSASANAAGSVVWREAMLLRHFGSRYPVPAAEAEAFFRNTPKRALTDLSQQVVNEPLAGLDIRLADLQQGSMFTRVGKQYVPGIQSYATPRTLAQLLFRLEQGRLVDAWSSLEMKRYLYMTKRRYRYAYAPELARAAIYFKSGSLYQCRAEEGYRCGKYMGNSKNFMNVVTIVEWPGTQTRYLIALMSNVLKVNSAWDHARLAVAIDEAVRTRAPVVVEEEGTTAEVEGSGRS